MHIYNYIIMRTIGELFYVMVEEVSDMTFRQALMILQETMLASIKVVLQMTEEQIQAVAQDFVDRLPEYMRGALQKVCSVNMFPASERTAKSIAHVFVWEV